MRVCIDIEANSLVKPKHIWLVVCKDIDTGQVYKFRNVTEDEIERSKFISFVGNISHWIGHNILDYDIPHLITCVGIKPIDVLCVVDTLIISRMVDYSRPGHSIEKYGEEFGLSKIKFNDFTKWSQELEDYCVRDVDICHKIYLKYLKFIDNPSYQSAIRMEHEFQYLVVNSLHNNGFSFNTSKAEKLLEKVKGELDGLDKEIEHSFPAKLCLLREISPKLTAHGTLHKGDFRWCKDGDLSEFNGGPFCRCEWRPFNPSSHRQIVDTLTKAGWRPIEKTQTHIDSEREINQLKYRKNKTNDVDLTLSKLYSKLNDLEKTGWKVSENNLATLPDTAPAPARSLAKRILLESRRRTLTEWLGLVQEDGRIRGKFQGIGAWTGRMSHQSPNTANIPNEFKEDGSRKLLGKELRSLWQAPKNRLLVGVDAEGIQLRIFAHYIDDADFTKALVDGRKEDKSDPHSLNQRILGSVCKSRQAAKRFVYALLLGGGINKLAYILEASKEDAESALRRLLEKYQGFAYLKENVIPADARRGWFVGLDGRPVRIPDDTVGGRRHLCMSGYLQNGEAVVMKRATLKWHHMLKEDGCLLVDLVHDEWQTEVPNNMEIVLRVAKMQADSLESVGQEIGLRCPLAGSYWNDEKNDFTVGTNWSVTH